MDDERVSPIPAAHECDESLDVLRFGHDVAFLGLRDVVQAKPEMILRGDARGAHEICFIAEQGDEMAGAGRFDRCMQSRERADMNHQATSLSSPTLPEENGQFTRPRAYQSDQESAARRSPPPRDSDSRVRAWPGGPGGGRRTGAPLPVRSRQAASLRGMPRPDRPV